MIIFMSKFQTLSEYGPLTLRSLSHTNEHSQALPRFARRDCRFTPGEHKTTQNGTVGRAETRV